MLSAFVQSHLTSEFLVFFDHRVIYCDAWESSSERRMTEMNLDQMICQASRCYREKKAEFGVATSNSVPVMVRSGVDGGVVEVEIDDAWRRRSVMEGSSTDKVSGLS